MILRQDDELYIHELDRLDRDKKMIKNELQEFLSDGILVRILDIPTTLMDFSGFWGGAKINHGNGKYDFDRGSFDTGRE